MIRFVLRLVALYYMCRFGFAALLILYAVIDRIGVFHAR